MPKPKLGKKAAKGLKGVPAGKGTAEVLVTTNHRGQVKEAAVKASPATTASKEQDDTSQHGIKRQQALKAAEALLKHYTKVKLEESKQKKQDLLATGWDYIHVQVGLSKMPERVSPKPVPISLPHPLYTADDDFAMCLIVKEDCKPIVKKALSSLKLTGVSEVVGLQELRTDYKEYQERRKLRDAFDLFLVDDRITPMLGKALGKIFFSRKKQPVPVRLGGKVIVGGDASSVAKRIVTARERTYLYRSHGNCVAVRIARTDFSPSAVADNVVEGVETIVKALPGKWKNVMSVSIKTPDSVALPVYNKMPTYLREKAMTEDEYVEVLLKEYEEGDTKRQKRTKKAEQERKEEEERQLRRDMAKLGREQSGDEAEEDEEEEEEEEADEFSRPDKQLVLTSGKEGEKGEEAKGKKRPVAAAVADKEAGRAKKVKMDAPLVTKKDKAEKVEAIKPDTGKKEEKGQKGKKQEAAVKPKEKMQVVLEEQEDEEEEDDDGDVGVEDDDEEEEEEEGEDEGEDGDEGGSGEDDEGDEDELEEEELRNEILAQLKGVLGLRLGGMNGQQLGEGEDDDDDEEDEDEESDGDDDDDEEEDDDDDAENGGMAMAAIKKLLARRVAGGEGEDDDDDEGDEDEERDGDGDDDEEEDDDDDDAVHGGLAMAAIRRLLARRAAGGGDSELDGDSDEDEDNDILDGDEDDAELAIFYDEDENDDGDVDDDEEDEGDGDEEEDDDEDDDEEEEEDKPTLSPPPKPTRVVSPPGKKPGKPDKRSVTAPAPAPTVPAKATKQGKPSPQEAGKGEKSAKNAAPPVKSLKDSKGRDQAKAAGRGPVIHPGELKRKSELSRAEGGKGAEPQRQKGDKPAKQGQGSKGAVPQVKSKAGAGAKPSNLAPANHTRGGANKPNKPQPGQGKQSATKQSKGKGKHR